MLSSLFRSLCAVSECVSHEQLIARLWNTREAKKALMFKELSTKSVSFNRFWLPLSLVSHLHSLLLSSASLCSSNNSFSLSLALQLTYNARLQSKGIDIINLHAIHSEIVRSASSDKNLWGSITQSTLKRKTGKCLSPISHFARPRKIPVTGTIPQH